MAGQPIWPCTALGVQRLRQPPSTPYWGPFLSPIDEKYVTRFSTELDILRTLAAAMRLWRDLAIPCHPTLNNWLPYYWNDFAQLTRYIYRIEDLPGQMLNGQGLHRSIRCALNHVEANKLVLR